MEKAKSKIPKETIELIYTSYIDAIKNIKKRTNEELKGIFENLILIKEKKEASELIAIAIENRNDIFTLKSDQDYEVWIYQEGIYIPNGKCEIKIQIREILLSLYNDNYAKNIIDKIIVDTMISQEDFIDKAYDPKNINLIVCKNGLLDITTKELRDYTPRLIFLNKIPVNYNPKALCPSIEKHFKDVLKSEEDIIVMFEIFGFCLYREYFIEKSVLFDGNGRNGKGKSINLIQALIGKKNTCAIPLSEIHEDSFNTAELFGKMANIGGDISSNTLKDLGQWKATTGRDLLSVNRKFKEKIHFINYAKHIFACNELPMIYETSRGVWDRWIVLDFPYTFVSQEEFNKYEEKERTKYKIIDPDHILKITTQEEIEGLLNKALEGLERLRKNKDFSSTKSVEEIKKNWIRKANSFIAFCEDNIEASFEHKIEKENIRKYFHLYRQKYNILKGVSDTNIKTILQEKFGVAESRTHDGNYFWNGIKIRNNTEFYEQEVEWINKYNKKQEEKDSYNKQFLNSYK